MIELTHSTQAPESGCLERAQVAFEKLLTRKELGFLEVGRRDHLWDSALSCGRELSKVAKRLVVLGMGGSSLGGQALVTALRPFGERVEFWDNIDSFTFWNRISRLPALQEVHWLIISKSGTTAETLLMAAFVSQHYRSRQLEFKNFATIITEPKENALKRWAEDDGIRSCEFPLDVGGRFSVLTPVGFVPAAFDEIDIDSLRTGAMWALGQRALVENLTAHFLTSFIASKGITTFWFYCDRLFFFGEWLKQLWAESLGKSKTRSGQPPRPHASTPWCCHGARDQHSVLQQIAEGPQDKFVTFFRVKESELGGAGLIDPLFSGFDFLKDRRLGDLLAAEAEGTRCSLEAQGVSSLTLSMEKVGGQEMGALFMLFELVVGSLGEALEIDAFNQPGVELSKKMARQALST